MELFKLIARGGSACQRVTDQIAKSSADNDFRRVRKNCRSLEKVATAYLKRVNHYKALDANEIELQPLFREALQIMIESSRDWQNYASLQIEANKLSNKIVEKSDRTAKIWTELGRGLECLVE